MSTRDPASAPLLTVDLESGTPIYRQIIQGIRRQVAAGRLPPRTPLPSVRQLAADLDINPNTVSKSYLLLERDGLVAARRRKGYYVAEGARERALAGDRARLDDVVNDFLVAGRELGLADASLLQALADRLDGDEDGGS